MPQIHNLRGARFGRLLVLSMLPHTPGQKVEWRCKCDCGELTVTRANSLTQGRTESCGCLHTESISKLCNGYLHGYTGTPTHRSWSAMLSRCNATSGPIYENYGRRGIKVCKRWSVFSNFLADMGERPQGKTLDRVNNDKGYSKSNCRWATRREQENNKRTNVPKLTFAGETLPVSEWAERVGCSAFAIRNRLKSGWSVRRTVTTPSRSPRNQ